VILTLTSYLWSPILHLIHISGPSGAPSKLKIIICYYSFVAASLVQISTNYGRPGTIDKDYMVRDNEHGRIFIRLNRFLCPFACFLLTCFPLIFAGAQKGIVQWTIVNSLKCTTIVRRLSRMTKRRCPPKISLLIQACMDYIPSFRLRTRHDSLI
jgi:hypothetical protein